MNRIVIIGSGGAGKSTLAQALGSLLQLPVIHLDRELWQPGWVLAPLHVQAHLQRSMITGDRWIIDGNYAATMQIRLAAADTVLFLDLSPLRCLWRVIWRSLRDHGRTRGDMAPGCAERLPNRGFLLWIATYRRRKRPDLLASLERLTDVEVHILRSPRQIRAFLRDTRLRAALGRAALAAALNESKRWTG